jgi:hypothetical protein
VNGIGIPSGDPWNKIKDRWAFDQLSITSEGLSITTLDISFKSKKW